MLQLFHGTNKISLYIIIIYKKTYQTYFFAMSWQSEYCGSLNASFTQRPHVHCTLCANASHILLLEIDKKLKKKLF